MKSASTSFVLLALPILLLACSEVTVEPGGAGGGGLGGGGAGGGDVCAPFIPEGLTPQPVALHIVNNTAEAIYLGEQSPGCSPPVGFTLEDDGGAPLKPALGSCELTCAALTEAPCVCAADCAAPFVTMVAPGGTHTMTWPGLVFVPADMPAACFADASCAGTCVMESEPPAEPLMFRSSAWTGVDCGGAPTCTCQPDPSGTCVIFDGSPIVAGAELTASATWTGAAELDLVFQ